MAKDDKQKIIIDAALEVFRDKGFANTRMADIANRAGVSYGLVYHYFSSKEVLFDVIVESWWKSLYEMLENEKTVEDGFENKLRNIICFFLDTYDTNPNLMAIFVTEVSRSSVYHTARGLSKFRRLFELFEQIMVIGQKKKFLRNDVAPHYLTYIFLGAIEAFLSVAVLGNEKLSNDRKNRATNAIINVFLNGAKV
jgi:TetR/AcrR family transcriptional regulator, fatty acid metabolism regulator protein